MALGVSLLESDWLLLLFQTIQVWLMVQGTPRRGLNPTNLEYPAVVSPNSATINYQLSIINYQLFTLRASRRGHRRPGKGVRQLSYSSAPRIPPDPVEIQDEAQDSQNEAQDGQDEGQNVQDEAQDGQDEAQDAQDESQDDQEEARDGQDQAQDNKTFKKPCLFLFF